MLSFITNIVCQALYQNSQLILHTKFCGIPIVQTLSCYCDMCYSQYNCHNFQHKA